MAFQNKKIIYQNHQKSEIRNLARKNATIIGFDRETITSILTSLDELLENVTLHAGDYALVEFLKLEDEIGNSGIEIKIEDTGDGIQNVELAMNGEHSTVMGHRGQGLAKVNAFADELIITSTTFIENHENHGTKVIFRKSKQQRKKHSESRSKTRLHYNINHSERSSRNMVVFEDNNRIQFTYNNPLQKKLLRNSIREYCIKNGIRRNMTKFLLHGFDEVSNYLEPRNYTPISVTIVLWPDNGHLGTEIIFSDQGSGFNINMSDTTKFDTPFIETDFVAKLKKIADDVEMNRVDEKDQNGSIVNNIVLRKRFFKNYESSGSITEISEFNWLSAGKTNPVRGESLNGDGILISENDDFITIGLFDGVGHGKYANIATVEAMSTLKYHIEDTFEIILEKIHQKLTHTSGCQLALLRIDKTTNILRYIIIGNLFMYLLDDENIKDCETKEGILGRIKPSIDVSEVCINTRSFIILHTDGVSDSWTQNSSIDISVNTTHYDVLNYIYDNYHRELDDSSIIVIQNKEYD